MKRSEPKLILQTESSECGIACLTTIANFFGHKYTLSAMRQKFPTSSRGVTLKQLLWVADQLQLTTKSVRADLGAVKNLSVPCILHWKMDHFVVLVGTSHSKITILDPAHGRIILDLEEAAHYFSGVAVEFMRNETTFSAVTNNKKQSLFGLIGSTEPIFTNMGSIVTLMIISQILLLYTPIFIQISIDNSAIQADDQLLEILLISFFIVQLLAIGTSMLQAWAVLKFGNDLSFLLRRKVIHHLLRLPADWHGRRHIGDILSRVSSLSPIQSIIMKTLPNLLLDAVIAALTVAFMIMYSITLFVIFSIPTAIYVIWQIIIFSVFRDRQESIISSSANEQSIIVESIRSIYALKNFGKLGSRETLWVNKYTDVYNAAISFGNLEIVDFGVKSILFSLQLGLVVFVALKLNYEESGVAISIGSLFAFMMFRQMASQRIQGILNGVLSLRLSGLHLERISDITLSQTEDSGNGLALVGEEFEGGIELVDAWFKYEGTERATIVGASLKIAPGEMIAFVGPSGSGKTTLMKLMLGLIPLTKGELRFDGRSFNHQEIVQMRSHFGVVMQNDTLLSGSLADNISFFDEEVDFARMELAARRAQIHDDIQTMPMKYWTWVGDMGASLSGGQLQRVLLARALYANPRVLFLDEGTANLDPETEGEIVKIVADLEITRIVVAHRPALVQQADRVFRVENGVLSLIGGYDDGAVEDTSGVG